MFSRGAQPADEAMFYQPQMQEQYKYFTSTSFIQVYLDQPELLDDGDYDLAYKQVHTLSKMTFYSTVVGVTVNVQIKRVPGLSLLMRPFWQRALVRVPLFAAPFYIAYNLQYTPIATLSELHQKYWKRIQGFQRTGDIRKLDPTGSIMRKMSQMGPPM